MKSHLLFAVSVFLLLLGSAAPAVSENWPGWRGANGLGVVRNESLPTQWSATENVKWRADLPERGNSTPIVWQNKVFITQPQGNRRLLVCYDRATGNKLWQSGPAYEGKERSHPTNPYASASPVTDGENVIAWFGSSGVYCYDVEGKERWRRDLGKQDHEWGYAASPVIHGDLVFINFGPGPRSFLVALNKKNGEVAWRNEIPEQQPKERTDGFAGQKDGVLGSWATPLVITANGREELILTVAEWIKAFDPKNGKELWRCGGLNPLIYTSTIFGEGVIVGMGGFHGTSVAVKPGGSGDVTETHRLWKVERTKNRLGAGVIHDGHIYIVNTPGVAECLELKTGKRVWEERLPSKGPKSEVWSSAVLAGELVYILNQSGDCVIFKASPTFEVVGVNSIGNELTNGSLAVADGELFIRTHQHLWCIAQKPQKTAQR